VYGCFGGFVGVAVGCVVGVDVVDVDFDFGGGFSYGFF